MVLLAEQVLVLGRMQTFFLLVDIPDLEDQHGT